MFSADSDRKIGIRADFIFYTLNNIFGRDNICSENSLNNNIPYFYGSANAFCPYKAHNLKNFILRYRACGFNAYHSVLTVFNADG